MGETVSQRAVRAWNEWKDSDEGKECLSVVTLNLAPPAKRYLENRLWRAFMAGFDAAPTAGEDA
jgi:hypothetical protein